MVIELLIKCFVLKFIWLQPGSNEWTCTFCLWHRLILCDSICELLFCLYILWIAIPALKKAWVNFFLEGGGGRTWGVAYLRSWLILLSLHVPMTFLLGPPIIFFYKRQLFWPSQMHVQISAIEIFPPKLLFHREYENGHSAFSCRLKKVVHFLAWFFFAVYQACGIIKLYLIAMANTILSIFCHKCVTHIVFAVNIWWVWAVV